MQLTDIQAQIKLLFHCLDTPQEQEIRQVIDGGSGLHNSIEKDSVLRELVVETGETVSQDDAGSPPKSEEAILFEICKGLLEDLKEDFNKIMEHNWTLFKGKLDIQQREIDCQGDCIIAFFSGSHEHIIDPQLWEIWKEMVIHITVYSQFSGAYFKDSSGMEREF